jgi:hypothetical protein
MKTKKFDDLTLEKSGGVLKVTQKWICGGDRLIVLSLSDWETIGKFMRWLS